MKDDQLATMDPHLRSTRTRGIPFLGAGAVYPVAMDVIEIKAFPIPDHWPRAFGMDVGWNRTAAIWGAWDRESDIVYLYDEHYVGQENPESHANSILGFNCVGNLRTSWIPGVIDPAANGRSQKDGSQLLEDYKALGLDLDTALNAVEAGVHEVYLRLSTGRLKIFSHLQYFWKEYLLYRRDKNGKIVKNKARPDHLMDSMRYLIVSGMQRMRAVPIRPDMENRWSDLSNHSSGWMAS